jgi:transposase
MMTERMGTQLEIYCYTIEDLVPEDNEFRRINELVDFTFIYDEVRHLYSRDKGRPSTDPVMLVKYLLVGFIKSILSERQIEKEIQVNNAYRLFLGLGLFDKVPDHSTISQLRRRKLNGTDLFRRIFEHILSICIEDGLVDGKLILTDSTHVKANASKKSEIKIQAEKEAAAYWDRLDRYEEMERERLLAENKIKPPRSRRETKKQAEIVSKRISTTDPDAGRLNRPGKPEGMHYLNHQSIDAKNGIIVDAAVTAGNVADCIPYLERIEYVKEILDIEAVAVDSGYDTSLIHKELDELGITIFTPEKNTSDSSKTEFRRPDFIYDEINDTFICPNGIKLMLNRLQRNESSVTYEYKASTSDCKGCQYQDKCLAPSQKCRRLQVNIFEKIVKNHHSRDGSPEYKDALKKRSIWSGGTFAAQKRGHNLKQVLRRGHKAAETHCLLSATAMNLKRMIKCKYYAKA